MADNTKVKEAYKQIKPDIRDIKDIIGLIDRVIGDAFLEDIFLEDSIARLLLARDMLGKIWDK